MTQTYTKLIRYIFLPLVLSAALWSGFQNVDCNNTSHLSTLQITQGDCRALEALWESTHHENWIQDDWDNPNVSAAEWTGVYLNDDNTSIKAITMMENNLSGHFPDSLPFTSLEYFNVLGINHESLFDTTDAEQLLRPLAAIPTLKSINIVGSNLSGSLPALQDFQNDTLERVYLSSNHFTGTIPKEWSRFTQLKFLYLDDNNLSGPLPDLSNLTTLHLEHNQFTFADFEPQMGWLRNVDEAWYAWQRGHYDGAASAPYYPTNYNDPRRACQNYYVDERDHVVYFDTTLRIEPRVPANTYSDHDYFAWFKENGTDEGQLLENGGQRIYVKEDANASDGGYYYYEANNSVVTSMVDGRVYLTYCSTPRTDGIHAIHDAAPHWGNAALPEGVATVDVTYRYSSTIRDADADDTPSVTLSGNPGWLSLVVTDGNFTLSGTPQTEDAGKEYNLTLTLTDGKLPQTRHWLLHVNTADLPDGITHEGETYTHDATHTTVQAPHAWISTPEGDTLRFTYPCEHTATAYAALTSGGALTSGYRNCETNATTPTLQGSYPAGTLLTLSPEMIEADVNLSTTITMGE